MNSLLDKLTGKAPLRGDSDEEKTQEPKKQKASRRKKPMASNMTEKKRDMSHLIVIVKWLVPILVCVAFVVVSKYTDNFINAENRATIASKQFEHGSYLNKIDAANANIKAIEAQQQADADRIVKATDTNDDANNLAKAFFGTYLTWSSGEQYNQLRNDARYSGSIETETVLDVLFPEQWYRVDPYSQLGVYYVDKEGLNLAFESLESFRLESSVNENAVYYGAIVTASQRVSAARTIQISFYAEYRISADRFYLDDIWVIDSTEVFG